MRAGAVPSTHSVSPCEKVDDRKNLGDKTVEDLVDKRAEEGSGNGSFSRMGNYQNGEILVVTPLGPGGKEVAGVEDEDSEDEDLGMDMGEDCGKVRVEKEGAVVKKLLDPKLPTQAVVEDHWLRGHVEYRNWCEVCVRARGKEWDHTKVGEKERQLPEYSFD